MTDIRQGQTRTRSATQRTPEPSKQNYSSSPTASPNNNQNTNQSGSAASSAPQDSDYLTKRQTLFLSLFKTYLYPPDERATKEQKYVILRYVTSLYVLMVKM